MPFNSYSDLGVNSANSEVKIRFDNRQRAFLRGSLPDYSDISTSNYLTLTQPVVEKSNVAASLALIVIASFKSITAGIVIAFPEWLMM